MKFFRSFIFHKVSILIRFKRENVLFPRNEIPNIHFIKVVVESHQITCHCENHSGYNRIHSINYLHNLKTYHSIIPCLLINKSYAFTHVNIIPKEYVTVLNIRCSKMMHCKENLFSKYFINVPSPERRFHVSVNLSFA